MVGVNVSPWSKTITVTVIGTAGSDSDQFSFDVTITNPCVDPTKVSYHGQEIPDQDYYITKPAIVVSHSAFQSSLSFCSMTDFAVESTVPST